MSNRTILLNVPESVGQLHSTNEDSLKWSGARRAQPCVLTYHEILPWPSQYLYRVTNAQFQAHLSFLSSQIRKAGSLDPSPLITFDDGHRSNFEQAFPLLEQFGLRAIFFVLAGCVGRTDKYISWDHARQLVAAGHRVQSHGWSHRLLTQCSSVELEDELVRSKAELEDRLGAEVSAISAPGGRWDDSIVDACKRAGYKYLFHSNPWLASVSRDGVRLQGRHMVTGRMQPKDVQKLLQASGARKLYARMWYGAKERVRGVLGDRLYHKLWCWLANWQIGEGLPLEVDAPPNNHRDSKRS